MIDPLVTPESNKFNAETVGELIYLLQKLVKEKQILADETWWGWGDMSIQFDGKNRPSIYPKE